MKHLERLSEAELLDAALADFARATSLPVVFGGYQRDGVAAVTSVSGNRTSSLERLRVETGRGLGGRAVLEARPRFTADYARSRQITHDYDREIGAEGIRSLVAVPVVVEGAVRAVLYGGAYEQASLGPLLQRSVMGVVNQFAEELQLRDELQKRAPVVVTPPAEMPAPLLEEIRSSYAELRSVSKEVQDPELRARLATVERRLARLGKPPTDDASVVTLAPREIDVLSQVALGCSNATVGRHLGLSESTVKAYLKSASAKLGCSNRHATVAAARRAGILP